MTEKKLKNNSGVQQQNHIKTGKIKATLMQIQKFNGVFFLI